MKSWRHPVLAAIMFSLAVTPAAAEREGRDDMTVLGYVEDVHVGKLGLEMKGKLDTGADSSSIYARDVKVYKKSGKDDWVTFRLRGKNGRTVRYDQDVRRFALIKLKTGGTIRRPVIHLPICVGGVRGLAEVNLADREDFEYDILIGREFLASRILVDSASTFIADDECSVSERD